MSRWFISYRTRLGASRPWTPHHIITDDNPPRFILSQLREEKIKETNIQILFACEVPKHDFDIGGPEDWSGYDSGW